MKKPVHKLTPNVNNPLKIWKNSALTLQVGGFFSRQTNHTTKKNSGQATCIIA